MTDWKVLAPSRGLDISAADIDRIVPILHALECAFRPLVSRIDYDTEPAIILSESAIAHDPY